MPTNRILKTSMTAILALIASISHAGAVHDAGMFTSASLPNGSFQSSGPIALNFDAFINGAHYSFIHANMNGSISFGDRFWGFSRSQYEAISYPVVAAFLANVDTSDTAPVTYGTGTLNGRQVVGANWIGVGGYGTGTVNLNSFQVILTDRSDVSSGDFDIQLNYDTVKWDAGIKNGVTGDSANVGYVFESGMSYQMPGSYISGAFLDGGPNALVSHSRDSNVLGQYNFQVRGGEVLAAVPEPETYALMAMGLGILGLVTRRRRGGRSSRPGLAA